MGDSYDPLLRIDQRLLDEGGGVRTPAQAIWRESSGLANSPREMVVLVHGFNNDRAEAGEAYAGLRAQQRKQLGLADFGRFDASLADDFWPGDANWGVLDGLDFLVYPAAVGIARDKVALPLAEFLRRCVDTQIIHFVAHSLGCRVVLEALAELARSGGGPRVGKVCLMAAAVPVEMVCPGGRLAAGVDLAESVLVLYSPDDLVLTASFPPGQTLAGSGEGLFPEAIGHAGNVPGNARSELVPKAGHGDYWGHNDSVAARHAANMIQAFLGFRSNAHRVVAEPVRQAPRVVAVARPVAATP